MRTIKLSLAMFAILACILSGCKKSSGGSITVNVVKVSNGAPIQGAVVGLSTNSSYDEKQTTPSSGSVTFKNLPSDEYFYTAETATHGGEGHFVLGDKENRSVTVKLNE